MGQKNPDTERQIEEGQQMNFSIRSVQRKKYGTLLDLAWLQVRFDVHTFLGKGQHPEEKAEYNSGSQAAPVSTRLPVTARVHLAISLPIGRQPGK